MCVANDLLDHVTLLFTSEFILGNHINVPRVTRHLLHVDI